MRYFVLGLACLLTTGLAWKRILAQPYSPLVKGLFLILALAPIIGPVFYLLIDPPESSPATVKSEEYWAPRKGAGQVWPSFGPLIQALRSIFKLPR